VKTGILPSDYEGHIEDAEHLVENIANRQNDDVENLINRLHFSSALTAEEYISIDDEEVNNEIPTDEEIISSFEQVEEEEVIVSSTNISTNEALKAFETAINFFEQSDLQIDYNELKTLKLLKKKVTLYNIQNLRQANITSYFNK
jgi:hypothetical protein